MPRIKSTSLIALALAAATLSGCVTPPTWVNRGPVDMNVWNGLMNCYTDANIIDEERMEGTLCATQESGFFGGGEPEVYFGPWNRKFMKEYASAATAGIAQDWNGKKVFLQCEPTLATDNKTVTKRFCKVTVNDQLLVSATVKYVK